MQHEDRSRVEALAQQLWEQDGRPVGQDDHYWFEAERQIAAADIEDGNKGQEAVTPAIPLPLPLK